MNCWRPNCRHEATRFTRSLIPESSGVKPKHRAVCDRHWNSLMFDRLIESGRLEEVRSPISGHEWTCDPDRTVHVDDVVVRTYTCRSCQAVVMSSEGFPSWRRGKTVHDWNGCTVREDCEEHRMSEVHES